MTVNVDDAWQEAAHRRFVEHQDSVVRRLRRLADDVERTVPRPDGVMVGDGPHVAAAQEIIHDVMWGLANLNLDGLVSAAHQADQATRMTRDDSQ